MSGFTANSNSGFTAREGVDEREQLMTLLELLGDKNSTGFQAKMASLADQQACAESWVQKSADAHQAAAQAAASAELSMASAREECEKLRLEKEQFISHCAQREAQLAKREARQTLKEEALALYSDRVVENSHKFVKLINLREKENELQH